jgi:exonuclease SbcC
MALAQVEKDLAALSDPRSAYVQLQHLAGGRSEYQTRVQVIEQQVKILLADRARIEKELLPYAQLDHELARIRQELEDRQSGYQQYLQHEKLAEQVPVREMDAKQAKKEAETAREGFARAQAAYKAASARFDEEALNQAETRSADLKEEGIQKREQLQNLLGKIQELEADIARVEAMQATLASENREYNTVGDLEQTLQHFRDLIKEAGPNIMRALLREISIQANRIFGEIMGDHSAELAWTNDYEIVLYKNGQERSFAQLSGGEQMSAALAVRLALLRRLSRLDIAFFDEPTQNMDGERRGNLAEQIRRVRGFDQLIVISHDDTFEQGLDSVIHLEKRDGKTVLVEDDMLVPA